MAAAREALDARGRWDQIPGGGGHAFQGFRPAGFVLNTGAIILPACGNLP